MQYKINIKNANYTDWLVEPNIENFNPINKKVFDNDILNSDLEIIESPIRNSELLGVIVINNLQTYGTYINNKLLYKVIPRNTSLPHFLVPYEIKKSDMGFSKNIQNKYVVFKFISWEGKHPIGQLIETIGPVNDDSSFYKFELYNKKLNISISKFSRDVNKIKEINFVDIIQKYNLVNRESFKVFSIDPNNCLDFDDAFSIVKRDNNFLISIYISNVPILIDYLNLWNSFSERVSTIYLPDGKIPLMPTILSDNLCSLKEKETRIAFCLDILVDENGNILNTELLNVAIKIKYNFVYESEKLLNYNNYKLLFDIVKKMYPTINDSHDLVSQLMIFMNIYCANKLYETKSGIFRSTIFTENNLPTEIKNQLLLSNYSGTYTTNYNETQHHILDLNSYIHITSPIRRIIDIINMVQFIKEKLSNDAIIFYNNWIKKIDYINDTTKKIKKLQIMCELLNKKINDTQIYNGYIIDNDTIYIIELKSFIKFKSKNLFGLHKFKLYLFNNEAKFSKKIKAELLD
jgi:exoribonuclease R